MLAVWLQGCSAVRLPVFSDCWAAVLLGLLSRQIAGSLPTYWGSCPASQHHVLSCLSQLLRWSGGCGPCQRGYLPASTRRQRAHEDRHPEPNLAVGARHGQCFCAKQNLFKHQSWHRRRSGFAFSSHYGMRNISLSWTRLPGICASPCFPRIINWWDHPPPEMVGLPLANHVKAGGYAFWRVLWSNTRCWNS